MGSEVHEQIFRSGGQSEARPSVFKSPGKLGSHLSTHCSRDESLSLSCLVREPPELWCGSVIRYHWAIHT
ncbi:hypothetical protein TNCV_1723591 [Trichonephila clavipes]|nr:hypothetical protein TNCV_1723591 [Trichonephila clavipes]